MMSCIADIKKAAMIDRGASSDARQEFDARKPWQHTEVASPEDNGGPLICAKVLRQRLLR